MTTRRYIGQRTAFHRKNGDTGSISLMVWINWMDILWRRIIWIKRNLINYWPTSLMTCHMEGDEERDMRMLLSEAGSEAMFIAALFQPREYIKAAITNQICGKRGKKNVRHSETCPVCGRKLVNLYPGNGAWKCRQCLNKDAQA